LEIGEGISDDDYVDALYCIETLAQYRQRAMSDGLEQFYSLISGVLQERLDEIFAWRNVQIDMCSIFGIDLAKFYL
jgi:hypothetical protein